MVNGQEKTLKDFIRDLSGIGIKITLDQGRALIKAAGIEISKKKQGLCIINCTNGGEKFPRLYYEKYGVKITPMDDNFFSIIPK